MTPEEIKEYYQKLLILQYVNLPKARGTVGAFVEESIADSVIAEVRDAFDIDSAIGAQLDILGEYRGVSRFVFGFSLTKSFFAMPRSTSPNLSTYFGFAPHGALAAEISWYFLRYQDITSVVYRMNDQEFRTVIKFVTKTQSSFLSIADIDDILLEFFGNFATLVDNGNMTITYNDSPADPNANLFSLIEQSNNLPRPAGVTMSVTRT